MHSAKGEPCALLRNKVTVLLCYYYKIPPVTNTPIPNVCPHGYTQYLHSSCGDCPLGTIIYPNSMISTLALSAVAIFDKISKPTE